MLNEKCFEEKCRKIFPDLLSTALCASRYGMIEESDKIIDAVARYRPDHRSVFITRALTRLYSDNVDEAIEILQDKALKMYPGDAGIMTYLGLAYSAAGKSGHASGILAKADEMTEDETTRELIQGVKKLNDSSNELHSSTAALGKFI